MMNDRNRTPLSRLCGLAALALALLLPAAQARADPAAANALHRAIEARTGQVIELDPRLAIPSCTGRITVDWTSPAREAVSATCLDPSWRLVVPVVLKDRTTGPSTPRGALVRRGEAVRLVRQGPGFEVQAVLHAKSSARAGDRLLLQAEPGGRLVEARVGMDGSIEVGP